MGVEKLGSFLSGRHTPTHSPDLQGLLNEIICNPPHPIPSPPSNDIKETHWQGHQLKEPVG